MVGGAGLAILSISAGAWPTSISAGAGLASTSAGAGLASTSGSRNWLQNIWQTFSSPQSGQAGADGVPGSLTTPATPTAGGMSAVLVLRSTATVHRHGRGGGGAALLGMVYPLRKSGVELMRGVGGGGIGVGD